MQACCSHGARTGLPVRRPYVSTANGRARGEREDRRHVARTGSMLSNGHVRTYGYVQPSIQVPYRQLVRGVPSLRAVISHSPCMRGIAPGRRAQMMHLYVRRSFLRLFYKAKYGMCTQRPRF